MSHVIKQKAFTIIELMLAMVFVSLLLLAVAMTVIQMANIYNRGLTLKEVNQAGDAISTELKRSISNTQPFDAEDTNRFTENKYGGRLCLGQYTYIWNYGEYLTDVIDGKPSKRGKSKDINTYNNSDEVIRFIKVVDSGGSYCSDPTGTISYDDSVELLDIGEHNLAIHDFEIDTTDSATDGSTGQRLYSISFIVGTNDNDAINYESASTACKIPGEPDADPVYCYVNKFDISVRAGSSGN